MKVWTLLLVALCGCDGAICEVGKDYCTGRHNLLTVVTTQTSVDTAIGWVYEADDGVRFMDRLGRHVVIRGAIRLERLP